MKTYPLLATLCVVVMGLCSCNDEEPVDSSGAISVTTAEVTNITDNTAQSGGNVILTGRGAIMAKGVCWGTESAPVVTGNYTKEKGEAGTFVSTLKNLVPGNTYYVRAYAQTKQDVVYGNEVQFSVDVISPNVATTAIQDITTTSAVSKGSLLFDGGREITECGICWADTENPTTADSKAVVEIGQDGTFQTMITELTPGKTYYVRAYVKNDVGTGYGKQLAFTTETALIFEDANFKTYLLQAFDRNGDGEIGKSEALAANTIDCGGRGIKSLAGVKEFTNVRVLSCNGNAVQSVDLSGMTNLVEVFLLDNPNLESVNMSGCASLWNFQSFRCKLSSLNLDGCSGLVHLHIYTNKLSHIDLSDCGFLEYCNISENQLEELDVRNNPRLICLWSNMGKYKSLDVSGMTQMTTLDIAGGAIEELNVSGCTNLQVIHAGDSNVKNFNLGGLQNLREVYAHNNRNVVESLDISGCSRLEVFNMCNARFGFKEWTFSSVSSLRHLDLWGTGMEKLNLSYLPNLQFLNLDNNDSLTSLNISECPNINHIQLTACGLSEVDLSRFPNMYHFQINESASLKSLNMPNNPNLRKLYVQNTGLTTLDISNCSMGMEEVNAAAPSLTTIIMKNGQSIGAFYKPEGVVINYN